MGALAPALKDRSAATDGASQSNFLFGGTDAETGEFGGPGTFCGGLALSKTVRCTDTPMTFSYMSDRQKVAPWGIHGGDPGAKAELFIRRVGSDEWLTITQAFNKVSPSKFANVPIRPGDRIRISSPAGGGWGPPEQRDPTMVQEDLRDGFITEHQARTEYAGAG